MKEDEKYGGNRIIIENLVMILPTGSYIKVYDETYTDENGEPIELASGYANDILQAQGIRNKRVLQIEPEYETRKNVFDVYILL